MKKIFSTILILSTVLSITSCKYEEDDIWDQSAAERIETIMKNYGNVLESSKGGWAMEYYPTNKEEFIIGQGYLITAKFSQDNTVETAMKNIFSANTYLEDVSTWDITRDQGPVLSFSSYNNCIHVFADPYDLAFTIGDTSAADEEGKGAQGDYEFVMVDFPQDAETTMLKGKKRGTYVRMTRLADDTDPKTYIEDCQAFTKKMFGLRNPLELSYTVGGDTYSVDKLNTGLVTCYPQGTDSVIERIKEPYLITKRNDSYYLRFRNKLTGGSATQEFVYDAENDIFKSTTADDVFLMYPNIVSNIIKHAMENKSWRLMRNATSRMSAKMASLMSGLYKAIPQFSYMEFRYYGGAFFITLKYSVEADFSYKVETNEENNTFKLTFESPGQDYAKSRYDATPAMQALLGALSQEFKVTKVGDTMYNMDAVRFTSTTDEDLWFELSIQL